MMTIASKTALSYTHAPSATGNQPCQSGGNTGMAVFDMPLAELQRYQGRNPRPPDLDEFWDNALQEMGGLDPRVELQPHPFAASFAECFDLFYRGVGGPRTHAKNRRPPRKP